MIYDEYSLAVHSFGPRSFKTLVGIIDVLHRQCMRIPSHHCDIHTAIVLITNYVLVILCACYKSLKSRLFLHKLSTLPTCGTYTNVLTSEMHDDSSLFSHSDDYKSFGGN